MDSEDEDDNEENVYPVKKVKQSFNDYLQSDDSSSENESEVASTIEFSDDEERNFEAHKKPKLNYEGQLEDNVASSDDSDDSEEPIRSPGKFYMRHIK